MTVASPEPLVDSAKSLLLRVRLALAAVLGTISGIAPHVLHHVGPIAWAAIVSGSTGTVVFGLLGFLLMSPSLLQIKRRFGTWLAPGIAVVVFGVLFAISTVWIGPIIRGELDQPPDAHQTEHEAHVTPTGAPNNR